QRAIHSYLWSLHAINMYAMKEGAAKNFGEGYEVMAIWKQRIDANAIITTPNSDVIYGMGFLDLAKDGPMVLDVPPKLQALIDDFWHRPIEGPKIDGRQYYADIGLPGPDKGKGGKYLVVPADYDGDIPEKDYYVYHSKTNGVFVFLRGFFDSPDNLQPAVDNMMGIRIYPLGKESSAKKMEFPNASGVKANMGAPMDGAYFDMLNRFVQSEVNNYPDTNYARGMMAAIGIAKGQEFKPTPRQKELLDYAAKTAFKMSKAVSFDQFPDGEKAKWYDNRQWWGHIRDGGDDFFTALDDFNFERKDGHYIDVDAQIHMYTNYYSMSPGMGTSIPGVGGKYLVTAKDANGNFVDGGKTYKLTLPPKAPANLFWSVTAYDAVTAAGLDNGQPFPSINSKDDIQKNSDGSVTLYFGPKAPKGKESNWVATVPEKGWFSILRLYGPEQPFFDKSWIPGDFELVD
uniref:DUF1254 domain-containing protein n=1 Tax=Pseudomaricurvus sp. TaxID=2004510 RepID=UPI003F6CA0C8